jgi:hypothetical protein
LNCELFADFPVPKSQSTQQKVVQTDHEIERTPRPEALQLRGVR